jgi:rare lipoprotein A
MAGESRGVPSTNPSGAAEAPAVDSTADPATGYWVQLGAYRQREGATMFQQRVAAELDWLAPRLGVFDDNSLFRLQAGPYASRDEASAVAERVHSALQLVPMIVERR